MMPVARTAARHGEMRRVIRSLGCYNISETFNRRVSLRSRHVYRNYVIVEGKVT